MPLIKILMFIFLIALFYIFDKLSTSMFMSKYVYN